jgi:hypothetical protein
MFKLFRGPHRLKNTKVAQPLYIAHRAWQFMAWKHIKIAIYAAKISNPSVLLVLYDYVYYLASEEKRQLRVRPTLSVITCSDVKALRASRFIPRA